MDSTDHETGEVLLTVQSTTAPGIDMETGELGSNVRSYVMPKAKFAVPKELIQPKKEPSDTGCCIDAHSNYTLFKKEEVITLQEEIILGCNKTSHRLFLIPTIFFFYRFCGILIAIIEVCLHVWAHKKNAQNRNEHIYYRSPLHVMTSQFCAVCRNRAEMDRVSKLQVKRQQNWQHHLNHVTKTVY